jgi:hypothetical protein
MVFIYKHHQLLLIKHVTADRGLRFGCTRAHTKKLGLKVVEFPRKYGKSDLFIFRDGLHIPWIVLKDSQTLSMNSLKRVDDFDRSDSWGGYRC